MVYDLNIGTHEKKNYLNQKLQSTCKDGIGGSVKSLRFYLFGQLFFKSICKFVHH